MWLFRRKLRTRKKQPHKVAALLVDMQRFFLRDLEVGVEASLIAAQKEIIRYCAQADIPLFVLEYNDEGRTIGELRHEIARVPQTKTIIKKHDDGFKRTALDECLQEFSITHLLLMGVNASFCVRDTARSALRRGYQIITADHLIANCKCDICDVLNKDREWYQKKRNLPHRHTLTSSSFRYKLVKPSLPTRSVDGFFLFLNVPCR